MILTYNGASSSPRDLPGSSPQGAFLGIFFFIVKYNGASLRPHIPRLMFKQECNLKFRTCKTDGFKKHAKDMHALYIDDLSEAEAIELKKQLVSDPTQRPFPLNYHERTRHVLPAGGILQQHFDKVEAFTEENKLKINENKSKTSWGRAMPSSFPAE